MTLAFGHGAYAAIRFVPTMMLTMGLGYKLLKTDMTSLQSNAPSAARGGTRLETRLLLQCFLRFRIFVSSWKRWEAVIAVDSEC